MRTLILAAGLAAFLMPSAARAQMACMSHDDAVQKLQSEYHERRTGAGITADGRGLVEKFRSKEGTWTILVTRPNGVTCVMAAGNGWQVDIAPFGDDS